MLIFKDWVYKLAWGVFMFLALAAPLVNARRFTVFSFIFFIIWEALGVLDGDPGDTLSEQIWGFYAGKPARLNLVYGVTAYLTLAAASIYFGTSLLMVGVACLILGLFLWLIDHFKNLGLNG